MVVADYCFMTGQDQGVEHQPGKSPILVIREVRTGATMSMIVPCKGDTVKWVVERCAKWIDDLGVAKVVMRCDQEASIESLFKAVRAARGEGSQSIIEHSAVAESQSNGAAERAVGEVKGMIRTMRAALERRLERRVNPAHIVFTWITRRFSS